MSLPFRLRTVFYALSICLLSACGGGGDDSTEVGARASSVRANQIDVLSGTSEVAPQAYEFTFDSVSRIEPLGNQQVGFIKMFSPSIELSVGHLKGNKQKFFVSAEVSGSKTLYECISAAWSNKEKNTMLREFGSVPATCSERITFDRLTDKLSMVGARIPSPSGRNLVVNINTTLPPIVFP